MEMNRYLIAAIYVMAGCVVNVPLKAEGSILPSDQDRCRLVITNTVKTISIVLEKKAPDCLFSGLLVAACSSPAVLCRRTGYSFEEKNPSVPVKYNSLTNPIRAPGMC